MKPTENIQGLYHVPSKVFYYIETGGHPCSNVFDRIRKTLIARGVLVYSNTIQDIVAVQLKPMSLSEAQEKNYTIVSIWINEYVKNSNKDKPVATTPKIGWGKRA